MPNEFGPLAVNPYYYNFDDTDNVALIGLEAPSGDATVAVVGIGSAVFSSLTTAAASTTSPVLTDGIRV